MNENLKQLIQILISQGNAKHPRQALQLVRDRRVSVDGVVVTRQNVPIITASSIITVSAIEDSLNTLATLKCTAVQTLVKNDKAQFGHGGFTLFVSVPKGMVKVGDKITVDIRLANNPTTPANSFAAAESRIAKRTQALAKIRRAQ